MSKTRQSKRSKVKPFIKTINYNHLMPTRYTLELEGLKGVVTHDTFKEVSQREDAKKTVKKALEERYTSGKNRWFFTPLSKALFKYPTTYILTISRILKGLRYSEQISLSTGHGHGVNIPRNLFTSVEQAVLLKFLKFLDHELNTNVSSTGLLDLRKGHLDLVPRAIPANHAWYPDLYCE
jgi:hypothetical protein